MRQTQTIQDQWSRLATFGWLQDALMLKARLEGSGIDAQIPEEHVSSLNPMATLMQVRVIVRTSDLARAREILSMPGENVSPQCPRCGSSDIRRQGDHPRNALLALLAVLTFLPIRKREKKRCGGCGKILDEA